MKKIKNYINCFKADFSTRRDYFCIVALSISIGLLGNYLGFGTFKPVWDLITPFVIIFFLQVLTHKTVYTESQEEMLELLAAKKSFIYRNTAIILFLFLPLLSNAQYSFTEVSLPTVSVNEYESDLISLDRDVKVISVQEIIGDSIQQVGCSEINLLSLVSKYATSKTEVHELETIVSYNLVGLECISQTNFHYRSNRLVRIIIETTTHKESKTTLFNL